VQTRAVGHSRRLRDVATALEENGMHRANRAWAEKKRDPTDGRLDVKPKKVEVHRTTAHILASSIRPSSGSSIRSPRGPTPAPGR
jgi:hypothetical protein